MSNESPEHRHLEPSPEHPITVTPNPDRVVVRVGDATVADTRAALNLAESNYPVVIYVPLADVDADQLERSDHATHCPYKGQAGYYHLPALGSLGENAVWEYAEPYPAVASIAGTVAFYADRVEIVQG